MMLIDLYWRSAINQSLKIKFLAEMAELFI